MCTGNDCSVKSQRDGWLLTVALIEASNIAAAYSFGSSDSYVIFKCNGKTKTSSIKFQTTNPVWNGNCMKCHFLLRTPGILFLKLNIVHY